MDSNPYMLNGPTTVSFSGGRTSAYLLRRTLEACDGQLPQDCHVLFQNTGKERNETLDFVQACSEHWNVPIVWLEYRADRPYPERYEVVNHNSASRNGEPFDALIEEHGMLPNRIARFCTQKLKLRVGRNFCQQELGWKNWTSFVGLRADEPQRVARLYQRCSTGSEPWKSVCPLFHDGVSERDVMRFWSEQPFDLQLRQHEGNCDLCFLKSKVKRRAIMYDRPDLAEWWIKAETGLDKQEKPRRFQPSTDLTYQQLFDSRRKQEAMFDMDAADLECACTD